MNEEDRNYLITAYRGKLPAQIASYLEHLLRASARADRQKERLDGVNPYRHILHAEVSGRPWHAHYHKFGRTRDSGYLTLCEHCEVAHCACHIYAVDSPNVALTYDDWGHGPQCTQCGLIKKC